MTPEQRINALNNEKLDLEYEAAMLRAKNPLVTFGHPPANPPELETCDKCGKDWVKSPVQMRGLLSPTTRHPSLGDDRLKHFCDRVCLMRYLLTPEEMKTLRGDKSK